MHVFEPCAIKIGKIHNFKIPYTNFQKVDEHLLVSSDDETLIAVRSPSITVPAETKSYFRLTLRSTSRPEGYYFVRVFIRQHEDPRPLYVLKYLIGIYEED